MEVKQQFFGIPEWAMGSAVQCLGQDASTAGIEVFADVEPTLFPAGEGLVCSGPIPSHTDPGFGPYTFLLVLRNDGYSVCYRDDDNGSCGTLRPQPPGTMIMIEAERSHALWPLLQTDDAVLSMGLWAAISMDHERELTLHEAFKLMEERAKEIADRRGN